MNLKIIFLIICLFKLFNKSSSVTLECKFDKKYTYQYLSAIYRCDVQANLNITSYDETKIDYIGYHKSSEVYAVDIRNKLVNYFPQGVEKIFAYLQLILIRDSNLKVVNQTDLKPFTSLYALDLEGNDIQALEDGLFDYNLNLRWISFLHNKILHVDLNVFDKLGSLITLIFTQNECLSPNIAHDSAAVKELVIRIKEFCQDSNYLRLNDTIKAVQNDLQTVKLKNFKKFSDKLYGLEKDFKNSEWINFPRFVKDVHNLTNHKKFIDLENLFVINTRISDVEVKDMPERAKKIENELNDFDEIAGGEIEVKIQAMKEKFEMFKDKFSAWKEKIDKKLNSVNLDNDMENLTDFGRTINVLGKKIMRIFDRKLNGSMRRLYSKI